jgi:folate-binding protein YgfZ
VHWAPHTGDGGAADPRLAALGERWLAPASADDAPADDAWRAHRLGLGVAAGREELGDILWLETNAAELNGVSFTKGCYVGQENTARMNWRQKVNRRLFVVPLDSSDERRRKCAYPELGLAVDHLRVEGVDPAFVPPWMELAEG